MKIYLTKSTLRMKQHHEYRNTMSFQQIKFDFKLYILLLEDCNCIFRTKPFFISNTQTLQTYEAIKKFKKTNIKSGLAKDIFLDRLLIWEKEHLQNSLQSDPIFTKNQWQNALSASVM